MNNSISTGENQSYRDRHVPGRFCPKCNVQLIVNEKPFKTTNPDQPFYMRRLVCPCLLITGCNYKEPWTPEVQAALDAAVVNVEVDF